MQELDNNMDELLRKAAEKYGLKEGDSQWDAIAPQLPTMTVAPVALPEQRRKRRFAFLLFFLPLLMAGGFVVSSLWLKTVIAKERVGNRNVVQAKDAVQNTSDAVNTIAERPTQRIDDKERNDMPATTSIIAKPTLATAEKNQGFIIVKLNRRAAVQIHKPKEGRPVDAPQQLNSYSNTIMQTERVRSEMEYLLLKSRVGFTPSLAPEHINIAPQVSIKKNDSVTKKSSQKEKGIYLGVVGGPSLQEVKSQGMKKAGFDFGLLTGYRFSDKLSIESGLLFAKKYYHSEAKYFNPAKTNTVMPANMNVLSLEGSSTVFELPVAVKYDFVRKKSASAFAKAGISSFLLTAEKNKYRAMVNGTEQNIISTYDTNRRYLVGALNFSAGYEHKIGKTYSIRIEPYVQLPLKGTGVGAMPVMSTGLHIGIIRSLH